MTSNGGSRSPVPGLLTKRAREIQQSEGFAGLPPPFAPLSLDPNGGGGPPLAVVPEEQQHHPLSSPPGLSRRPRAGTLPSTFHLSPHLALPSSLRPPASLPTSGATTPDSPSDFAYSSASSLLPPQLANSSRLRSGSLTLPSSGLANAFGPSVFSSNSVWPQQTPAASTTTAGDDRERESGVRSPDSSSGGMYGDGDSHVRTLDYLGLDGDSPIGGFGPFSDHHPSVARGRGISLSTHQLEPFPAASALLHQRVRSNTVATFPRTASSSSLPPSSSPSPYPLPSSDEFFGDPSSSAHSPVLVGGGSSNPSSYHRSDSSTDSTRLLYSTSTSTPAQQDSDLLDTPHRRARAATIGILDESREVFMRKRAGTTVGEAQGLGGGVGGGGGQQQAAEYPGGAASVMARGIRALSLAQAADEQQTAWATSAAPASSRPLTPEMTPPPAQQPTRSLWIGNLDPKTSTAELQAVFAPYGAIESLRLIPEKECGFVNFVSLTDALHAKEDVLNRLGGQLTKTSGMVRIGFGKADAAAVAPSSLLQSAPGGGGGGGQEGSQPTRALWVGSIPSHTTPNHLLVVFAPFGPIESARVLTHKSCGFINYERLDDAIAARKALNGRDILGAEVGAVRIGFAKVPTKVLLSSSASPSPGPEEVQDYRSNLVVDLSHHAGQQQQFLLHPHHLPQLSPNPSQHGGEERVVIETVKPGTTGDWQLLMREISGDSPDTEEHVQAVAEPRLPATYYSSIPQHALTDPSLARRYVNADAPRLRDIRKRLDSPQITADEVDSIAYDLVDESVALASDYIGNTLIQKIFERASLSARLALLERIAPHLATIGTHKNGTWAVQKIISCVQTPEEFAIVEQNLQPYTPPLLLNDFGNYVVQGALRFGTDFIFDAMVDRCWEIGSGRFGARSTRQTLESPRASRLNIKRVAISIVLNSIPLATSSNGALLVTWLLDASNLPGRYRLLAPRFSPHLVHLCTHKLASVAVLKLVNQRVDPQASRLILDALFDANSKTLEDVLGDQVHGAACITKLLSSPFLDGTDRPVLHDRVRTALAQLRVQSIPAYRKLFEDLGLAFVGPPAAPSPHFPNLYHQPSPPQLQQQWSPQPAPTNLNQQAYQQQQQPYASYDYPPPMPYGANFNPYQPYGNPYGFVPPPYYSHPPNSFHSPPPHSNSNSNNSHLHQNGNGNRNGGPPAQSPMLAPMPVPGASAATGFSPIASPDPFRALRSGDPLSGFNPAFSYPYGGDARAYGMSPVSTLRPEALDYYSNPPNGAY
ncbi:hypothetical protein RQP46_005034 [Phenoliferia psychrophenolica]